MARGHGSRIDEGGSGIRIGTGFARALVRWRWLVVAAWAVIGVAAAVVAPGTVERLNIRGGSDRPTEAIVAERMVQERFERPLG